MVKSLITLESIQIESDGLKRENQAAKARRIDRKEYKDINNPDVLKYYPMIWDDSGRPVVTKRVKVKRTAAQSLLARIRRRADHKGFECELTVEDCTDLQKCYYCGGPSSGFDRVDSSIGYTHKNIVAACGTCNCMKMSMNQDDFIEQCKWIAGRF